MSEIREIINHMMEKGYPVNFICGMLGNIQTETASTFNPKIVQYSAKRDNEQYTLEADIGAINFATDKIGYGLCQWTSSGRKAGLLAHCKTHGYSVGDLKAQLEWIDIEIQAVGYANIRKAIKENWSVEDCARVICTDYERPLAMQKDAITKEKAIQVRIANALIYKEELFGKEETKIMSNGIKVCIDAGHDNKANRSPVNSKYYESDFTFAYTNYEKDELERLGFDVVLTRSSQNQDLSLDKRGKASKGCALFISNHTDACGTESVDYPSAIIPVGGKGIDVEGCKVLANRIVNNIHTVIGTTQAGKVYAKDAGYDRNGNGARGDDEYYGVLAGAQAVKTPMYMIVEHSFHTNKHTTNWLLNDANVRALAISEAHVIAEYLCAKYGTKPSASIETPTNKQEETIKTTPTTTYVVQRGDTLSRIAKNYNVTVDEIMALNPSIKTASLIFVGQKLLIPATSSKIIYYTVVSGDNLSKIANRYTQNGHKVTYQQIARVNNISFPYTIYKGQTLIIP